MAHAVYTAHGTFREYLQRIEDTLASERVDDALSTCRYMQTQFPESLEVQRLLGEIYLKQGALQEAQQTFDWVLTNDPENVVVYCDRALISERMNDYETALDCYQQAYELSRGNSDIRRQFNMLSAKSGQQGFMLSRAGLARLYMRGDLLTQATQEWELVLSITPDRLDARTGLLETYWRQGLDERVEQLARQILRDIPECLKALLLLAYIMAPRDMQQARELMQRAERLDPDLGMAHDLFSDAIAAQPGHPFWKLVNKAPARVEEPEAAGQGVSSQPSSAAHESVLIPDSLAHSSSADALVDWNMFEGWQSIDALTHPSQQPSFLQGNYSSEQGLAEEPRDVQIRKSVEDLPTMEVPLPYSERNVSQERSTPFVDMGRSDWMQSLSEPETAISPQEENWASSPTKDEAPEAVQAPPQWLSMLTQDDQQPQHESEFYANGSDMPPGSNQEDIVGTTSYGAGDIAWEQGFQNGSGQATDNDEEESFFGPAWLRSLGATSIDTEMPSEPVSAISLTHQALPEEKPLPSVPADASIEAVQQEEMDVSTGQEASLSPSDSYEWFDALSTPAGQNEHEAEDLLMTLEGLEQDLRQQGFVPLEPKTLSTIAQSQPPSDTALTQQPMQEDTSAQGSEISPSEWYERHNALLSSVLAQLGHHVEQPAQDAQQEQRISIEPEAQPYETYRQQSQWPNTVSTEDETPSWAAAFSTVPSFPVDASPVNDEHTIPVQESEIEPPLSYAMPVKQPESLLPMTQPEEPQATTWPVVPAVPEPLFVPQALSLPVPIPQSERQKPAAFNDVFSDDLEVTMKRPAVRLQPVQPQTPPQGSLTVAQNYGARTEQGGYVETGQRKEARPAVRNEISANYRERLRRGHQHQQVGDYDEAMQEYRIIIRGAPELLNDVISNVRGLLALAPKYSAGYRVLGDAYMQQGEYLQAMDAYNQALAITKKTRA